MKFKKSKLPFLAEIILLIIVLIIIGFKFYDGSNSREPSSKYPVGDYPDSDYYGTHPAHIKEYDRMIYPAGPNY